MDSLENKESRSYSLAADVGRESRKLYDELYKKVRETGVSSGQANPCKEFVL